MQTPALRLATAALAILLTQIPALAQDGGAGATVREELPHRRPVPKPGQPGSEPGAEARTTRVAAGVFEILGGLALVPFGLALSAVASIEKCEENDGMIDLGVGPCSKDGPSTGGQAVGAAIAVGGLVMLVDGISRVSTPDR